MNNKDKYIKEMDNIKVDENLKRKLIDEINTKENKKNNLQTLKHVIYGMTAVAACFAIVISGALFLNKNTKEVKVKENPVVIAKADLSKSGLKKIENMEELKRILSKELPKAHPTISVDSMEQSIATNSDESKLSSSDYSETNVQEEGVDEADIVKTDGKYIYYLKPEYRYSGKSDSKVIVIDLDLKKVVAKIELNEKEYKNFYASEMYLNNNNLIVMATRINDDEVETVALIYDIQDKENIKKIREVSNTGDYTDSRMVGSNLYFISNKYAYYNYPIALNDETKETEDSEEEKKNILPKYRDTLISSEYKEVNCTDIYYLEDSEEASYTMVTAVNIDKKAEANMQSFLGLGSTIYCSQNNMYIIKSKFDSSYSRIFGTYNYNSETEIFKFKLADNNIEFVAKGNVTGTVNDQFSMDEYKGNFRIATTGYNKADETTNNVFVLNEKLEKIGEVTDLEEGEKIYSVRFIGKIGYVVTFEQVDPLLVIDFTDIVNPKVKGKLEIPGYSSYLHPYDENHIIGIGRDTKDNGYGGVTTTGIKISMFDISDLDNPKEIFKQSIGDDYAYSEVLYNHKAILCDREKEVLAFPASADNGFRGVVVYKIDLNNKKFIEKKISEEEQNSKVDVGYYKKVIDRIIYIGDCFYTISQNNIMVIDMDTYEKVCNIPLV